MGVHASEQTNHHGDPVAPVGPHVLGTGDVLVRRFLQWKWEVERKRKWEVERKRKRERDGGRVLVARAESDGASWTHIHWRRK